MSRVMPRKQRSLKDVNISTKTEKFPQRVMVRCMVSTVEAVKGGISVLQAADLHNVLRITSQIR